MKKLLLIAFILYAGNATASSLPNCPSDQSKRYHNCFGTYIYNNGDKYVGEWKDNKKHGQGTYNYADGSKYVGEWKDDDKHGQSILTFGKNSKWAGDKFVGEFKDNERLQGTYTHSNGGVYVGEFKGNQFHGQGTYTFSSGSKYTGEWKFNKRNGYGVNTFHFGGKYVGEWKDDNKHGQGTKTYVDGTIESGFYMNEEYIPSICEKMGLTKGTESFGQCVVSLINEITFPISNYFNWEFLGKSKDDNSFYIDYDSIRRKYDFIYWWDLSNYPTRTDQGILSFISFNQGDCNLYRLKSYEMTFYSEKWGEGNIIEKIENTEWNYAKPNSMFFQIIKAACEY